jgi:hypothetical protein
VSCPTAVALLLLLPTVAQADGAASLPGFRTVWKDIIFTVEQDYPDYEFYLVISGHQFPAERLPLSPSNPVRVPRPGEDGRYRWANAYAVRKSLLAQLPDLPPSHDWFQLNKGKGVVKLEHAAVQLDFRESLLFTDTRDRVEITYRVEVGPDGGRLVKVAENAGDPWVRRAWVAAGALVLVGIVGLGIWRLRRVRRRPNL